MKVRATHLLINLYTLKRKGRQNEQKPKKQNI